MQAIQILIYRAVGGKAEGSTKGTGNSREQGTVNRFPVPCSLFPRLPDKSEFISSALFNRPHMCYNCFKHNGINSSEACLWNRIESSANTTGSA